MFNAPKQNCMQNLERFRQSSILSKKPSALFPLKPSIGKKKPEKNQGFKGIRTHDLRDTGAMRYQLSYEATHWNDFI